jgi:hypothetical protein
MPSRPELSALATQGLVAQRRRAFQPSPTPVVFPPTDVVEFAPSAPVSLRLHASPSIRRTRARVETSSSVSPVQIYPVDVQRVQTQRTPVEVNAFQPVTQLFPTLARGDPDLVAAVLQEFLRLPGMEAARQSLHAILRWHGLDRVAQVRQLSPPQLKQLVAHLQAPTLPGRTLRRR